jgi:hypothetical protein
MQAYAYSICTSVCKAFGSNKHACNPNVFQTPGWFSAIYKAFVWQLKFTNLDHTAEITGAVQTEE